jgi:hypothetical protein
LQWRPRAGDSQAQLRLAAPRSDFRVRFAHPVIPNWAAPMIDQHGRAGALVRERINPSEAGWAEIQNTLFLAKRHDGILQCAHAGKPQSSGSGVEPAILPGER